MVQADAKLQRVAQVGVLRAGLSTVSASVQAGVMRRAKRQRHGAGLEQEDNC